MRPLLVLLLAVVAGAQGRAYDLIGTRSSWDDGTIRIEIKLGRTPRLLDGSDYAASVQVATAVWNTHLQDVQLAGQIVAPGSARNENGVSEIAMDSSVHGEPFGPNTLAVTTYGRVDERGDGTYRIVEADITINNAVPWDSYRGEVRASAMDIRRVAIHELGHLLGLDHPDEDKQNVVAIMNRYVGSIETPQTDDITGIQLLYGVPPGTPRPVNDRFADAPLLTFSSDNHVHGSSINATKETGEPNHAPDEPGGASVWWKWTAPADGILYAETTGTNFDTLLAAYTGTAVDALTQLAANDDQSEEPNHVRRSRIEFPVTRGTTYHLAVDGWDGEWGAVNLYLRLEANWPAVIDSHPAAGDVWAGDRVSFRVSARGTPAPTFQWQRLPAGGATWENVAGSDYGGATSYELSMVATVAMNGDRFRCVVTNVAGSATSNEALLTVRPRTPPVISGVPADVVVEYGEYFGLFPTVTGSPPLTLAWHRDGVPIPGATNSGLIRNQAVTADAGIYTLTATNSVGTATTPGIVVKVKPAVPPVITRQPRSVTVAKGETVSLGVEVTGSRTLRYQWYREGLPVSGAVLRDFHLSSAPTGASGRYQLVVTNDAGSTVSAAVELTVLPAVRPEVHFYLGERRRSPDNRDLYLSPSWVPGTRPLSYQWFKDGVPVPGATSESLYRWAASEQDAGVYTLQITNEAGVASSADIHVTWSAVQPWLGVERVGDVVWFLAASPGRILRYDLAAEQWLPTVYLAETKAPTAFCPTPTGVFIAYGTELAWRNADLQGETAVVTGGQRIDCLVQLGSLVYYADDSVVRSRAVADRAAGPASTVGYLGRQAFAAGNRPAVVEDRRMILGAANAYPTQLVGLEADAVGASLTEKLNERGDRFNVGRKVYVWPDGSRVIDSGGVVRRADTLAYAGSVGLEFDDMAFLPDGKLLLLRHRRLCLVDGTTFVEIGRRQLAAGASALYTRGTAVFAFGAAPSSTGNPVVERLDASGFSLPMPAPAVPPEGARFSIDDAFVDAAGIINLVSRSAFGVIRWDPQTRAFRPTVALRGAPVCAAYAKASNSLLLAYSDGAVTRVDLATGAAEQALAQMSAANVALGLVAMDDLIHFNFGNAQSSGDFRLVLGPDGLVRHVSQSGYLPQAFAWDSPTRRLYAAATSSQSTQVEVRTVSLTGALAATAEAGSNSLELPLRFSAEGTLAVAGNGRIVNGTLAELARLDASLMDGAWLSEGVYGLQARPTGAELRRWARTTYAHQGGREIAGLPLRLLPLADGRLAALTLVEGYLAVHVVDVALGPSQTFLNLPGVYAPPEFSVQPKSVAVTMYFSGRLTTQATGGQPIRYQWQYWPPGAVRWLPVYDDEHHAGSATSELNVAMRESTNGGLYRCLAINANGQAVSSVAQVSLKMDGKWNGIAQEVGSNIVHPNGNTYDQVLSSSSSVTLRADPGQIVRTSFVDLTDDIVQVEFAGAGMLTLTLDAPTGPAAPVNYSQTVNYMRGHARIVVTGADETTNLSVFSVGRLTAFDPTGAFDPTKPVSATNDPAKNGNPIFKAGVAYDGMADLASISIVSENGKFGGLRTSNASYFAIIGPTGICAPGVEFAGPVFIGDISAADAAQPAILLGSAADVRITGGSLEQLNGAPVAISGLTRLQFTAGVDSHGRAQPAQANKARLQQDGVDVTTQVVTGP